MKIVNHKLDAGYVGPSPNHGGALVNPTLLVMHFTASGGAGPKGDADFFMTPAAKASAHVVVGRDGAILQVVPFNVKAWHAGVSVWRGVKNCNDYSIGIEVDNWGKLNRSADGQVRAWTGAVVDAAKAVSLTHKHESTSALWETYAEAQLRSAADLARLILEAYPSITEIVGHEDIAPGRKVDPGPAFPMSRFQSLVQGRGDGQVTTRTVNATRLNARGGPGIEFEKLGAFLHGTQVEVIYDQPGAWAQVRGVMEDGATAVAWVADQYLS